MTPLVELYSTESCGLCAEVRTFLVELQSRIPFELREVKLAPDDPRYVHYLASVPVLIINHKQEIKAPISPDEVIRLVKREARRNLVFTAGTVLKWISVLVAIAGIVIRLMGDPELGYLIFAAALAPFVAGRLLLRNKRNEMPPRGPKDLQQDDNP